VKLGTPNVDQNVWVLIRFLVETGSKGRCR
jgi:hypothetical protein